MLANFTEQGIRNIKDSPKRADAFKDMAKRVGATHEGSLLDARTIRCRRNCRGAGRCVYDRARTKHRQTWERAHRYVARFLRCGHERRSRHGKIAFRSGK